MFSESLTLTQEIVSVVASVAVLAGTWKLLTKMGEKGWKALVPVYSTYLLYKNAWKKSMFFIAMCLRVICAESAAVAGIAYYFGLGHTVVYAGLAVMTVASIARMVLGLVYNYKLSKSFGHRVGYTIGLTLLPEVFVPVLGFGKSEFACA